MDLNSRNGWPLGRNFEIEFIVACFEPCLTGFDVSSSGKIVMAIEIGKLPRVAALFRILKKKLAFKTLQIIHQYNYYN
jgi:hypothetical protein